MSIQVKDAAGAWRTVTQPWVKISDTDYRPATKVFVKIAGVWREAWPLQPGPVSGIIPTTTYRNDRIELDVSWSPSVSGEPTTKYFVTVTIPNSYTTTVVVNAPSTSITLTNNGAGFSSFAGQGATATVYAQSAAGRNSDPRTSGTVTIAQLPAPPQPTSYTVTMWQCALHHTWAHAGGNRIDGVEILVQFNGSGASTKYAKTTFAADYQSWNPATIPGGAVNCYCRTYGAGGVSAWISVAGTMPNPVTTSNYRFGDGYLRASTSGISPAVQIHAVRSGGNWVYEGDFGAGAGEVYVPESVNWARDRSYYQMLLRPVNNANGWVGRDQYLGWALKLPNPHYIGPTDSATFRGSGWRSEQNQDFQGASQAGLNAAFFFYGNQFYDYLSTANIGYNVGVTGALIAMQREASGQGAAVSPQLMVHRAGAIGEDISWGGSYATNALARNQVAWVTVPADWAYYLKERLDGWKGIGCYHPNTQLLAGLGYVSAEYMTFTAWNYGTINGGQFWLDTVAVYHNG